MATGPGDELAATATGYGGLRASDADRERVIGILKAAFVEGRLDRDEFDRRVGKAFVSRTYAELAAHTADLTAKPIAPKPPKAARAQRWRPVLGPGRVLAAATALYAGLSIWVSTTPNGGDNPVAGPWLYAGGIVYMLACFDRHCCGSYGRRAGEAFRRAATAPAISQAGWTAPAGRSRSSAILRATTGPSPRLTVHGPGPSQFLPGQKTRPHWNPPPRTAHDQAGQPARHSQVRPGRAVIGRYGIRHRPVARPLIL